MARFHVDIFMACFNDSYKIWLGPHFLFLDENSPISPTCHFFSEVKVGKSPFRCWPHGFLSPQMKAFTSAAFTMNTSNTSMTSLQSGQHHSAYASDRDDHSTHILVVFSHIFRLIHLYLLLTNLMVCGHNHIRPAVRTENPHLSVIFPYCGYKICVAKLKSLVGTMLHFAWVLN